MIVLVVGDEEIGDVEDQVASAAIADRKLVPGAEPVEHRKAGAMERNFEPLRGLAAMRMGDQEIAAALLGEIFKILEIADQNLLGLDPLQNRRLRGRHRRGDLRPDLVQQLDRSNSRSGSAPIASLRPPE